MPFIPEWAIGVGLIVIAVSIAQAIRGGGSRARIQRGRRKLQDVGPELDELQRRLTELEEGQRRLGAGDDLQQRLSEVEERLDFVERMLTRQRDAERMSPPKS